MQDLITFLSHHTSLTLAAIVIIALLLVVEFLRAKRNHFAVNTAGAVQLINRENAVVIDIRSTDHYANGHIVDAHSFVAADIKPGNKKFEKYKNKPVILVCDNGVQSHKIAAHLIASGYKAYSLSGGMRAWNDAGIPIVKG